jgi:acetyltransferase-like isoleucine patch superfamily enzyme
MFYSKKKLVSLGCKKIGRNCLISNKVSIYSKEISLGDNVRLDDYVTLKGNITIKNNVHIAKGCTLSGGDKGIFIDELTAISNYVQLFTVSDDYFAPHITSAVMNRDLKKKYLKLYNKGIFIGKNVLIGAMTVILPGAVISNYSSVGALSVVNIKINQGLYYSNHNKIVIKKRNIKKIKSEISKIYREIKL